MERPFHAYIARPISGRTSEEAQRLKEDTAAVKWILESCGITAYDPGSDPKATAQQLMPDGAGYQYSREKLAEADFAIFLLTDASWGVGAQNEIATSLVL